MRGRCLWTLVIAAAVCADAAAAAVAAAEATAAAAAGDEDKADGKGEREHRQSLDAAQTMRTDVGPQARSAQSAADGYYAEPLGYRVQSKRARSKQYGFGLGKRLYRQYEFGLGKRSASKQYGFGLGKRASPTFYGFGLGRRASPQYSFGLGKRVSRPSYLNVDDREADYTYNDVSEEKKRTADDASRGQRFAFGLGKRDAAGWDGDGDGDGYGDMAALTASVWHPAVRRARLQYGFGLGKRAAQNDPDEYADTLFRDDVAEIN